MVGRTDPSTTITVTVVGWVGVCARVMFLGYTAQRRADSNSVLDMAKFVNAHWPSQVEVFGDGDSPSRRGCAYSVAGVQ